MSASLLYDAKYLKTISGILKLCCMICCFIGILCVTLSGILIHNFRGIFYISVAGFACLSTCLVLLARLFQLFERNLYDFQSVKYEAFLHAALASMIFVASAVAVSLDVVAYSCASFFGFLAACFYIRDAHYAYRLSRCCDASTQTHKV